MLATIAADRLSLREDPQGLSSRGRHRPDLRPARRPRPTSRSRRWSSCSSRRSRSCRPIRPSPASAPRSAPRASSPRSTSGRMFISLKPLAERGDCRRSQRHRPPAPRARSHPRAAACACSPSQDIRVGARQSQLRIPVHAVEPRHRRAATPGRRRCSSAMRRARARPTSAPTASRAACRRTSPSTGTPPRGSASASRTSTTRSTTPSRSARSRSSTRAQPVSRRAGGRSALPARSRRPRAVFVPGRGGAQVPLIERGHDRARPAPLSVNHQGQFPAVTFSYNLTPDMPLDEAAQAASSKAIAELQHARHDPRRAGRRRQGLRPAGGQRSRC